MIVIERFDLVEPRSKHHAQCGGRVPGNGKTTAVLGSIVREGCDDQVSTRPHSSGGPVRILGLVVRIGEEMKGGAVVPNVDLAIEHQIEHISAHESNDSYGVSEPFGELIERST